MVLMLDGRSLTLSSAIEVAEGGSEVRIRPESLRRMRSFRKLLEKKIGGGEVVYGVNTGFGSLSNFAVNPGDVKELQLNLIRSHSAGVGDPMPPEVVRGAMVIRLNSLLNGNSAVRTDVAELLMQMLNRGIVPVVPEFGSLGASGDLVPSAHLALTMVGEGQASLNGKMMASKRALAKSKLKPLTLQAKEGLSLINSTCFTTALGLVAVDRGHSLLNAANSAVALSSEALGACMQSFDERLIGMKRDQGQAHVARRIRRSLKASKRVREEPVPQDPYSIRCVPQVHGSLYDALTFAGKITVEEMNSVSDNPVLLENGRVLHGGNFHAQPVAMVLDLLSLALSYLGVISLSRISLLLSRTPSESKYLAKNPGLESGLMILQYTATSLAAENATEIYPQSSYPASVSGGIEDHASHGVNAGRKALVVAKNVSSILAIELIIAANSVGEDLEGVSQHSKQVVATVRRLSPLLNGDRSQAEEVSNIANLIIAGKLP